MPGYPVPTSPTAGTAITRAFLHTQQRDMFNILRGLLPDPGSTGLTLISASTATAQWIATGTAIPSGFVLSTATAPATAFDGTDQTMGAVTVVQPGRYMILATAFVTGTPVQGWIGKNSTQIGLAPTVSDQGHKWASLHAEAGFVAGDSIEVHLRRSAPGGSIATVSLVANWVSST